MSMDVGALISGSISCNDLDAAHQPVEQPGQEDDFADEGQHGDDIDVRGVVVPGDHGGDDGQHKRLKGVEPDVGEQHLLHDQEQLHHEHQRREQRDELRSRFQWEWMGSWLLK